MSISDPSADMLQQVDILQSYLASQGFSFAIVNKGYRNWQCEGTDAIGIFRKNNLTITIGYFYSITYVNYSNGEGNSISHSKYMETLCGGLPYQYHGYHSKSEFADITNDLMLYGQDFFAGGKRIREALEKEEKPVAEVKQWRAIFIKEGQQAENESLLNKAKQLFREERYKETIQLLKKMPQLSAWGKKLLEMAIKKDKF